MVKDRPYNEPYRAEKWGIESPVEFDSARTNADTLTGGDFQLYMLLADIFEDVFGIVDFSYTDFSKRDILIKYIKGSIVGIPGDLANTILDICLTSTDSTVAARRISQLLESKTNVEDVYEPTNGENGKIM